MKTSDNDPGWKAVVKTVSISVVVCLGLLVAGAASHLRAQAGPVKTLQENMAASQKEHLVPGKTLVLKDNFRPYRYCEVGLITGTSKENAVANIYNTTGAGDCSPEQFASLDAAALAKETHSLSMFLNPPRWWVFDEFEVYEIGDLRTFGNVKAYWMAVASAQSLAETTQKGFYHVGQIARNNAYVYHKGKKVYLMDTPDGQTFVMQAYTNAINKTLTMDALDNLGSMLTLPAGWKFRVKVLDKDLRVTTPAPDHIAFVFQDNFRNAYMSCDSGRACSYIP